MDGSHRREVELLAPFDRLRAGFDTSGRTAGSRIVQSHHGRGLGASCTIAAFAPNPENHSFPTSRSQP